MKNFLSLFLMCGSVFVFSCSDITNGLQHNSSESGFNGSILQSYEIIVNNFKDITYVRDVTLSINPGDADEIRFSNDQLIWSDWESAVNHKAWVLSSESEIKTVYAEFRKSASIIADSSDSIEFIEKLLPANFTNFDSFGSSVAVSSDGNTVVIGAENYTYTNASNFTYKPGAVTVHKYDGIRWSSTRIIPGNATEGDKFGASVAVSSDGNRIIVGSPGRESGSGCIYYYQFESGSWVDIGRIYGSGSSYFGGSVAVSGDGLYAAAGAIHANSDKGEVSLFSLSNTSITLGQNFTASDGLINDRFGCSVSVNNDASVIVVGAENKKVGVFTNAGQVYVFRKTGISYTETKLSPSSSYYNNYFGCSVSASSNGNVICAGEKGSDSQKGSAVVFVYTTAYVSYPVSDAAGMSGDQFGFSIAVSGDGNAVLTGSPYSDNGSLNSGKLCRFEFNGTSYVKTNDYSCSDSTIHKHLGLSAALNFNGSVQVSGAVQDFYGSKQCGTSYVFRN